MSPAARSPRRRLSPPASHCGSGARPAPVVAVAAALALAFAYAPGPAAPTEPLPALLTSPETVPIAELIRTRIEPAGLPARLEVGGDALRAGTALPRFYAGRGFRPAWVAAGSPGAAAAELLEAVRRADRDGLAPESYHLTAIEDLFGRLERAPAAAREPLLADIDLLLTDAFLVFGAHLLGGRVNPETLDPEWIAVRRERDLVALLEEAIASRRIAGTLAELLPDQAGYYHLRAALARYRRLTAGGGWNPVPEGPALRPGDADPRLPALRRRLAASGDLGAPVTEIELYDPDLEAGVRRFQARHGLEPDGVVGRKTLAALNVPAADRVRQLELNLERWRWLPEDLGQRYVLVNIPEFGLWVVEGTQRVLEMRVVVGRDYRRTPVFSSLMRYLVFNPAWEIPRKLAIQDKLPLIREDPAYLAEQGIRVFDGWGADRLEVDPAAVDWAGLGPGNFPYRLRQEPGPKNALGKVKFMFPNRFDVYLHDTPARELFDRAERDFSSGCIRLERAMDLARYVLAGDPAWTPEAIEEALAKPRETTVPLPQPLPVHLLYWTAWVEAGGTVHFRRDLYGRDDRLAQALAPSAPLG